MLYTSTAHLVIGIWTQRDILPQKSILLDSFVFVRMTLDTDLLFFFPQLLSFLCLWIANSISTQEETDPREFWKPDESYESCDNW